MAQTINDKTHSITNRTIMDIFAQGFEEMLCVENIGGKTFTIPYKEFWEGGKYEDFKMYTVGRFMREFDCCVWFG